MPSADAAVYLASVLNTTVEELVLGEDGRDYILDWARRNGWQATAPPEPVRVAEIKADLLDASEDCYEAVKLILRASANKERAKRSEENPAKQA